jgi:pimeloyl-ACP methyl ester carboxylesterase
MATPRQQNVSVLGGAMEMTVNVAGEGDPVLFLHSAGGFYWDDFLDGLSERHRIYAPHFPGTAPGKPNEIEKIDNLWDTVIAYDDLLGALGLERCRLIGHSFGGLLAAELAAHRPSAIEKLVLIAPIGLWREDAPYSVWNWCTPTFDEIGGVLFYDQTNPAVVKRMTPPEDPRAADQWTIDFIWTLGCTGKVVWPIPDKGLRKRIHRITAPTLVVWGENDELIPPVYAEEFGRAIANAEVAMLPRCGHEPPLEQRDELLRKVETFFGG